MESKQVWNRQHIEAVLRSQATRVLEAIGPDAEKAGYSTGYISIATAWMAYSMGDTTEAQWEQAVEAYRVQMMIEHGTS